MCSWSSRRISPRNCLSERRRPAVRNCDPAHGRRAANDPWLTIRRAGPDLYSARHEPYQRPARQRRARLPRRDPGGGERRAWPAVPADGGRHAGRCPGGGPGGARGCAPAGAEPPRQRRGDHVPAPAAQGDEHPDRDAGPREGRGPRQADGGPRRARSPGPRPRHPAARRQGAALRHRAYPHAQGAEGLGAALPGVVPERHRWRLPDHRRRQVHGRQPRAGAHARLRVRGRAAGGGRREGRVCRPRSP